MVDLGLPSGLLWADRNIGANSEEDFGLLFQWGSSVGYSYEEALNYSSPDTMPFHEYNEDWEDIGLQQALSDGKISSSTGIVNSQYDAATIYMGNKYHTPTAWDIKELIEYTDCSAATINGIHGAKFSNKNDSNKYIFIPYSYYCSFAECHNENWAGYIWSSNLPQTSLEEGAAFYLAIENADDKFTSTNSYIDVNGRFMALSIRGVSGNSNTAPFTYDNL